MTKHSSLTLPAKTEIDRSKLNKKENLKQRAYLNSLAGVIDYAGLQITGFFVNPFLVAGLGPGMYGVWQILGQLTGYTKVADTRASQALKWTLANKRHVAREEEFKSDITSALIVTAIILPFALCLGAVLSWYAPQITQVDPKYYSLIRSTCAILISTLVVNKFFDLFDSVLGGMNLGYKRMGLRFSIVAVGGLLKVWVITQGFGLIGLSVVQAFVSLMTGLTLYLVVKKNVPWFSLGKTNFSKIKSFGKLSGWFMAFSTLKILLLNSDKVILGYVLGPIIVAKYALTMFTSAAVQGAMVAIITGMAPGICSLFGKGEFDKVIKARQAINHVIWLFSTSIGVSILFLNNSFLQLWVGGDHYAGHIENFFILLIALQAIFFQFDSCILNSTVDVKRKVWLSACSTALSLILALMLVNRFEIIGLCLSFLIGRLFYTIGFPMLLKRSMGASFSLFPGNQIRLIVATIFLFTVATYAGQTFIISNGLVLVAIGIITTVITAVVFCLITMNSRTRAETWEALSGIQLFKLK